jgi:hypothetical protein
MEGKGQVWSGVEGRRMAHVLVCDTGAETAIRRTCESVLSPVERLCIRMHVTAEERTYPVERATGHPRPIRRHSNDRVIGSSCVEFVPSIAYPSLVGEFGIAWSAYVNDSLEDPGLTPEQEDGRDDTDGESDTGVDDKVGDLSNTDPSALAQPYQLELYLHMCRTDDEKQTHDERTESPTESTRLTFRATMSSEGTGAIAAGGDGIAAGDVALATDMVGSGLMVADRSGLYGAENVFHSTIGFVMGSGKRMIASAPNAERGHLRGWYTLHCEPTLSRLSWSHSRTFELPSACAYCWKPDYR